MHMKNVIAWDVYEWRYTYENNNCRHVLRSEKIHFTPQENWEIDMQDFFLFCPDSDHSKTNNNDLISMKTASFSFQYT